MDLLKQLISMKETKEVTEEAYMSKKMIGQLGNILTIDDDNELVENLAKALGVKDGWELTNIKGNLYAAYNRGDRLTIFDNKNDFQEDEDGHFSNMRALSRS